MHFGSLRLSFASKHGASPYSEVHLLQFGDTELGWCSFIDFLHFSCVLKSLSPFVLEPLCLSPHLLFILNVETQGQQSFPSNSHVMHLLCTLVLFCVCKLWIGFVLCITLSLTINSIPAESVKTLLEHLRLVQSRDFLTFSKLLSLLAQLRESSVPVAKHGRYNSSFLFLLQVSMDVIVVESEAPGLVVDGELLLWLGPVYLLCCVFQLTDPLTLREKLAEARSQERTGYCVAGIDQGPTGRYNIASGTEPLVKDAFPSVHFIRQLNLLNIEFLILFQVGVFLPPP